MAAAGGRQKTDGEFEKESVSFFVRKCMERCHQDQERNNRKVLMGGMRLVENGNHGRNEKEVGMTETKGRGWNG